MAASILKHEFVNNYIKENNVGSNITDAEATILANKLKKQNVGQPQRAIIKSYLAVISNNKVRAQKKLEKALKGSLTNAQKRHLHEYLGRIHAYHEEFTNAKIAFKKAYAINETLEINNFIANFF